MAYNYLIDEVFGENAHATFQTRGRALQVSRINQILKLAEKERYWFTKQTREVLHEYDESGGMGT